MDNIYICKFVIVFVANNKLTRGGIENNGFRAYIFH